MRAPYSPVRLIYGKNSKIGHSLTVRLIVPKIRYFSQPNDYSNTWQTRQKTNTGSSLHQSGMQQQRRHWQQKPPKINRRNNIIQNDRFLHSRYLSEPLASSFRTPINNVKKFGSSTHVPIPDFNLQDLLSIIEHTKSLSPTSSLNKKSYNVNTSQTSYNSQPRISS